MALKFKPKYTVTAIKWTGSTKSAKEVSSFLGYNTGHIILNGMKLKFGHWPEYPLGTWFVRIDGEEEVFNMDDEMFCSKFELAKTTGGES